MIAVAIDGPAGAGKSTISREVARRLGFIYVDTGALYRAVGLYAYEHGADTASSDMVVPLLPRIKLELEYVDGKQRVLLNGLDVSDDIRKPPMSMAASDVSAMPQVRAFLLDLQRNMAKVHNVVMDGRDIGTVILPDAQIKIFLTASVEERARRRYEELTASGEKVDYRELLAEVVRRDRNDSNREHAPLKIAPGAIVIDTTGYTLERSIDIVAGVIKERLLA